MSSYNQNIYLTCDNDKLFFILYFILLIYILLQVIIKRDGDRWCFHYYYQ